MFEFKTIGQLAADTYKLAGMLPPDVLGVVGVARSGMIPATIMATHLHCPLGEVETFIKAGVFGSGNRMNGNTPDITKGNIVVVEDGCGLAYALNNAAMRIEVAYPQFRGRIITAAVYATKECKHRINFVAVPDSLPMFYEWAWLNTTYMRSAAWDIDGALCFDGCPPGAYADAKPLFIPRRYPIPLIITNRLERDRAATEHWLKKMGIMYGRLVMNPTHSEEERASTPGYPSIHKIQAYQAAADCNLYVESQNNIAGQIYQATGKAVLCCSNFTFWQKS